MQCNIGKNCELRDILRQVILLIWDYVLIEHYFYLKDINQMLQDIWNDNCLLDGLSMVMRGDFAQILSIVCQGTRTIIIDTCIQRLYIWPQLFFLFLQQNMRLLHNTNN